MKIVFVNTIPLWGGGEHWTFHVAREFSRRGHDVLLLAVEDGPLLKAAQEAGLRAVPVPSSWWPQRRRIREVREQVAGEKPDLLVANSGKDVRLANRIRPQEGKSRVIFRRGLDKPISDHPFHRQSLKQVQIILANSLSTRQTLLKCMPWYPEEDIQVVYNPVDVDEFLSFPRRDVRGALGIDPEAFVVGIIARLTRQKGHEILFRALREVAPRVPSARLLVVGDGELRDELSQSVRELGVEDRVAFTGHVQPVQPYYDACDVVAIPSLYEGFCFVAVEAQLMEKPIVASNASSLPEVIQDGATGYLVPCGEADALAEKIALLAGSPELRRRMGRQGRLFASERFGARRIYEDLETLFESVSAGIPNW